jgi:hypothetical protein
LSETPPSATADGSSSRSISSGIAACHAGAFNAAPTPSAKVKPSRVHAVSSPATERYPRTAATKNMASCVQTSTRRRSTTSASAPAGNASRKNGRLAAVCMSDTRSGDDESPVITHAAAVVCIHVPTFETSDAIQKPRKSGFRSGRHADVEVTRARYRACAGRQAVDVASAGGAMYRVPTLAAPARSGSTHPVTSKPLGALPDPLVDAIAALLVFAICAVLYVVTLTPGLAHLGGDGRELTVVAARLGLAHPSGYPLYTWIGHLFTRLVPLGDVAYRMNLMSATLGRPESRSSTWWVVAWGCGPASPLSRRSSSASRRRSGPRP